MIAMVMRDDQVIDATHAGDLRGQLDDSIGVADAGVAGIDQQRLPGRRDDQRGGAPFDIDPRISSR